MKSSITLFVAFFAVFLPSSLVAQVSVEDETPKKLTPSSNEPRVPAKTEHVYQVVFVVKRDTPMVKPTKEDPTDYKDDCAKSRVKDCDGTNLLKLWPTLAAGNKKDKGFRPIEPPELKAFPILLDVAEKKERPPMVSPKKRRPKK